MLGRSKKRVVVWGLSQPARLRVDGGVAIDEAAPEDEAFVRGFAAGLLDMLGLDFARRLWSGRLSEFLGPLPLDGTDAYRLDVALRGLGFRRRAERLFRTLSARETKRAESWAVGVNAWIDQRELAQSATYRRLETRPRLVGAADALLLRTAPREVANTAAGAAPEVAHLFALLDSARLRGPGSVGAHDPRFLPEFDVEHPRFAAPVVTARTVLDRDDRHLYVDPARPDQAPRRLYVDRPNVAVKGGEVRRPWVRRTPEGWLISDALQDAEGPEPPAGPAQVVEWPVAADVEPPTPTTHRDELDPDDPWRVHQREPPRRLTLDLVPKRG